MHLIGKYKAIIITSLITGIVTFSLFSFHISKNELLITETFYDVETEIEPEILEQLEEINDNNAPSTNRAFNEDESFKAMMRNFKTVSVDDFEKTTKALEKAKAESTTETTITSDNSPKHSPTTEDFALKDSETKSYKDLQALLDKKQNGIADHAEGKSTLTYSLKNRRLLSYDTPRYLCENSGKIVVNINVNNLGQVTEAYINGASNSTNQCLHDHAIEYAKSVHFNNSETLDQIGTITFYFKGKR